MHDKSKERSATSRRISDHSFDESKSFPLIEKPILLDLNRLKLEPTRRRKNSIRFLLNSVNCQRKSKLDSNRNASHNWLSLRLRRSYRARLELGWIRAGDWRLIRLSGNISRRPSSTGKRSRRRSITRSRRSRRDLLHLEEEEDCSVRKTRTRRNRKSSSLKNLLHGTTSSHRTNSLYEPGSHRISKDELEETLSYRRRLSSTCSNAKSNSSSEISSQRRTKTLSRWVRSCYRR